jgi:hypothetical protein
MHKAMALSPVEFDTRPFTLPNMSHSFVLCRYDTMPPADAHLQRIADHVSAYLQIVRSQLLATVPKAIVHCMVCGFAKNKWWFWPCICACHQSNSLPLHLMMDRDWSCLLVTYLMISHGCLRWFPPRRPSCPSSRRRWQARYVFDTCTTQKHISVPVGMPVAKKNIPQSALLVDAAADGRGLHCIASDIGMSCIICWLCRRSHSFGA